jgi:thiamine kinase-like enzyme
MQSSGPEYGVTMMGSAMSETAVNEPAIGNDVLEGSSLPGLTELRLLLHELLDSDESGYRLVEEREFRPRRVYRLRFCTARGIRSLVVKRMELAIALRNQLVMTRWLPAIQLSASGPALMGVAAERNGHCVWHVYEDLGDSSLETDAPDQEYVKVAVDLIAEIHTRFAGHLLLPHCRLHGEDLGVTFFTANVRDAIHSLESLQPFAIELPTQCAKVRDRLLARLYSLRDEQRSRAQALVELGGPETLLHGDLWRTNTFVVPTSQGLQARLIDWDHAGVGPISYDLSTFLLRYPQEDRTWILDAYRAAVSRAGWQLPAAGDLNFLFETAECARFANCMIWPAVALLTDHADWGFDELAEVDRWFEAMRPVLPGARLQAAGVP